MTTSRSMECGFCPKVLKYPEDKKLRFRQWDIGQGTVKMVFCSACGEVQKWTGKIIYKEDLQK